MRAILPVVAVVLLAGCGLKNDLYLPEPEPETSPTEVNTTETSSREPAQGDDDDDATNS